MGHSRYDPATQSRRAWNAGKMVGTKQPLTQKQIWAIRFFLEREGRLRDRALFDLAIDSKLRGCDLIVAVPDAKEAFGYFVPKELGYMEAELAGTKRRPVPVGQ